MAHMCMNIITVKMNDDIESQTVLEACKEAFKGYLAEDAGADMFFRLPGELILEVESNWVPCIKETYELSEKLKGVCISNRYEELSNGLYGVLEVIDGECKKSRYTEDRESREIDYNFIEIFNEDNEVICTQGHESEAELRETLLKLPKGTKYSLWKATRESMGIIKDDPQDNWVKSE